MLVIKSYKRNVGSMTNADRRILAKKALSLNGGNILNRRDESIELNLTRISKDKMSSSGMTGLGLFMNELVYDDDTFIRKLRSVSRYNEKMAIVKEYSPILWSVLSNICGQTEDEEESGTCMIFSSIKLVFLITMVYLELCTTIWIC